MQVANSKNDARDKRHNCKHKADRSSNAGVAATYDIPRSFGCALHGSPNKKKNETDQAD